MLVMSALKNAGFGGGNRSEEKILEQVDCLIDHIEPKINDGEPIEIFDVILQVTGNIMHGIFFGKQYDFGDPELTVAQTASVRTGV